MIPVAVSRWASLVPMGKSVAEYLPSSPSGNLNCYEVRAPVANTYISDYDASDALSDNNVFGMLTSSIVTASVVEEKMRYGPILHGNSF